MSDQSQPTRSPLIRLLLVFLPLAAILDAPDESTEDPEADPVDEFDTDFQQEGN